MQRAFQSLATCIIQKDLFKMVIPVQENLSLHCGFFDAKEKAIVLSGKAFQPPAIPKEVLRDLEEHDYVKKKCLTKI